MKKLIDFIIVENRHISNQYSLLILSPADGTQLPEIKPGQFVQVAVDAPDVLLRRPISVNNVDKENNRLWLLVRRAGKATNVLADMSEGTKINILLPLGNGFNTEVNSSDNTPCILVGGGVGIAPLLYLGKILKSSGIQFEYLIGARSKSDLLQLEYLQELAPVNISTDDGSYGEQGVVTQHSCMQNNWHKIFCCGPAPMMKAVAKIAKERHIDCEVSLENMMACGLGACLCCVEKTVKGNVCVCTEGPVFNINQLTW